MKSYKGSKSGGVDSYELRENGIILKFKDGKTYVYSYKRPGKIHVDNMKRLAKGGSGLTTYVNKYVRDNYDDVETNLNNGS
jgi:hypothetical protein